jgi:diaminopimelate epimerase
LLTIGNADGSFAENSGNGTRIYARFLWDEGQIFVPSCTIVPPAGPIPCTVGSGDEVSALLAPCSAAPALTHLPLPAVSGFRASAGNPHFVIPVKEFPSDWQRIAAAVAGGGAFPRGSNVEFAKMLNSGHIDVRVWERGVGRTKSCGSGAACCAATFFRHFSAAAQLTVSMEGGTLRTEIEGGGVRIGGPVTRIG